jgi:hypothetical protein
MLPDTSEPEIVPQSGAAEAEPVPVCVKNFLVVVVLPDNLANAFDVFEYSMSPVAYEFWPVPPFTAPRAPDTAAD